MESESSKGLVLIDAEEVKAKIGIRSDSKLYELAKKDPNFPKPIKEGRRYSRWVLGEIDSYILRLIQKRDQVAA